MFKPKQSHPKWYLWMLRHNPKYFFRFVTGREQRVGWHYEWKDITAQAEINAEHENYIWLAKYDDGSEKRKIFTFHYLLISSFNSLPGLK